MTVTSHIHPGLSAWVIQTYASGTRVSSGGGAYQCVNPGSSTVAPSGTFGLINNGGQATWRWLSHIDYTTVQAWINSWPGTLVDNLVGMLWNDSVIVGTVGTQIFTTPGTHTMGSFTATLTCAPGESIKDATRDNAQPVVLNPALGVTIQLPASGVGGINYIAIADTGLILDGIQFQDPNASSGSTILSVSGASFTMRSCIMDGYSQGAGACMMELAPGCTHAVLANCLFVDRNPNLGTSGVIQIEATTPTHRLANCTFVSLIHNTVSNNGCLHSSTVTGSAGVTVTNCAILNWDFPAVFTVGGVASPSSITLNHCCLSAASAAGTLYTDGGSNLYSRAPSSQLLQFVSGEFSTEFTTDFNVAGVYDFRENPSADGLNLGATDTTDIPTSSDFAGRGRVSGFWDIGFWELSLAAASYPVLIASQQEQPSTAQPRPLMVGSTVSSVQSVPAVVRSVFARQQEQPSTSHPLPVLRSSLPGRATKLPVIDYILTVPQRPDHPPPYLLAGVQGPNILPPTTASTVSTLMIPPDQTSQTQPRQPVMLSGLISAVGILPGTRSIIGGQEQPSHPLPTLRASLQGPDVRPSQIRSTIYTSQEQPSHPLPQLRPGPFGQLQLQPVTTRILALQEVPNHPLPVLRTGVQGPSVAPPSVIGVIVTRQEQPGHPLPVMSAQRQPDPAITTYPLPSLVTRQEQPPPLPTAVVRAGVQGPNVRVPVTDRIFVPQQQPEHLQPVVRAGPTGQNVGPPVTSTLIMRQEQPQHPLPAASAGVQGPNVRSPAADTVLLRQEQPGHPLPTVRAGVQGPNVLTKVTDYVLIRQEQPGHPPPIVRAGVQGPNVFTKVTDSVLVRQEQPGHPLPTVRAGVQGPNVAPPSHQTSMLVRQEQPGHPLPVMPSGVQLSTFLPGVTRHIITRQEQPGHPLPAMRAGVYTNRPFVQGRTVVLVYDG